MKLSETLLARRWLGQFSSADRLPATLLLDSLVLISYERLVRDLLDLIENESQNVQQPIALIPVREVEHDQSYYGHSHNKDAKPKLLFAASFPGSEAIIAQLFTTVKRLSESRYTFVDSPSLRNMREAKCRSIFFIDDLVGSGNRLKRFLDAFEQHKTIKSWYSYGLIQYYVLAYSITEIGGKNILHRVRSPEPKYVMKCPTFDSAPWTEQQKAEIEDICRRYAPKKHMELGYEATKGLLVFGHSVPNNIPSILCDQNRAWKPLFPNRAVPMELLPVFASYFSVEDEIEQKLSELGQIRLSQGTWLSVSSPYLKRVILVLSTMTRKSYSIEIISDKTGLTTLETRKILSWCREWGFIDEYNSITKLGADELEHARRLTLYEEQPVVNPNEFYYPQKLRRPLV